MIDLPPKTKRIGDTTYSVGYPQLEEARPILLLLTKRLAPGLEGLADALAGGKALGDADAGDVFRALSRLLQGLEDADLAQMTEVFGKVTTIDVGDGKNPYLLAPARAVHFRGRLADYFEWLAFAVEVNYADFFARLAALLGRAPSPEAAAK